MAPVPAVSLLDVALLLASGAVVILAAALTTALLRPDSWLDAAVSAGVVAAAGVSVVLLAAGSAGLLKPAPVIALELLWAAGAALLAVRTGTLPARPSMPRLAIAALRGHPWEAAIVALATLALGWQLLVAVVLDPFAYDALTYHLTTVATWLQAGNLDPTPLSLCCARYPGGAELLFAWPVLFLGSDQLVDTVQIAFAVLGALAVAGIARSAGLGRAPAAAAGGLFAVTPVVLAQAPTNYADVIVAAGVLAALHALVRYAATGATARLVVAGLASGLVLGTKGTGILWAAVLAIAALALVVVRARRSPAAGLARAATAFLAGCLALGAFWYLRNWIDTGNPLHPFRVEVAGVRVFEGPLRVADVLTVSDGPPRSWPVEIVRSWASDLRFWQQGAYDYQQRQGGLGPLWPWLGVPLLPALAIGLVRRRSPVLLVLALAGLVLALQPYRWWSRFTIVLAATGALAIVAAATWAPRRWRVAVRCAALVLAVAGVALVSREVDPAARARPLPAREVVALVGAPAAQRSPGRLFFGEYRFLEHVPANATVLVDLHAPAVRFVYPLLGRRHSRRVLPATSAAPPAGSWVVTSAGRPLDRRLRADARFRPAFAERGVRVWAPRG
ncbi:MAG: hypothetical protein QOE31_1812 [Solirubrobacteraceae bacterium]|nr:hypothetical protein [Solirubrobacteraceae bacterium]